MEDRTARNGPSAEEELAKLRHRFTEEEERLFGERRYRELAERLVNRAEQESGKSLAQRLLGDLLAPAIVLLAVLTLDFGVRELVIGLAAVVLLHVLARRAFDSRAEMERAALRAWARAVEEERGPVEGVDVAELVERLGFDERKMLEDGRIEELAERLEEAGGRKSGRERRIVQGALGAVVAGGIAGAVIFGWPVLLLAAPLVVGVGFFLHTIRVTDEALEEKASAGRRLRGA